MLNERKREAEQFAAFRDKMRNISGKFPPPKAHAFSGTAFSSGKAISQNQDFIFVYRITFLLLQRI
jgi:hypothetical protein